MTNNSCGKPVEWRITVHSVDEEDGLMSAMSFDLCPEHAMQKVMENHPDDVTVDRIGTESVLNTDWEHIKETWDKGER